MQETVKADAAKATGIPTDRMLICATHTHSGGSLSGGLGTKADPAYCEFLPARLIECIKQAAGNLRPARIGWSSEDHPEGTYCRVFIRRPDCLDVDPLGRRNVRAMMHPGYQNPQFIGPCGPSDPQISVLAVQTPDGRPIALLANYSMHYFGADPISADYYGDFVRIVSQRLAAGDDFVYRHDVPRHQRRPAVAGLRESCQVDLPFASTRRRWPRPPCGPTSGSSSTRRSRWRWPSGS